ncbi:uncharacterized protein LOC122050581 [Zingiber officinale]|uniref:DC1 domain-containing protein n=1 Tax=Zingiber officinale TaxID=94328 RepID=A0A8J5LS45_ZINOF|nr:uncharacterized protein LOC122050581 [Zingiber officinale]KAG6521670.1 hypothetical protein ZIOFF_018795 [Zingiber officinale]
MGRLGYDARVNHFSHPHPLELTSPDHRSTAPPPTCAGCALPASAGAYYSCKACAYALHVPCAQMPPRIRHPAHPHHSLTLLAAAFFDCAACGQHGAAGFSYRCAPCGVDFHARCASMPLSVEHAAHDHPLTLVFSAPYEDGGGFSCDACGGVGGNHWLYRCAMCEFDAHVGCATADPAPPQSPTRLAPLRPPGRGALPAARGMGGNRGGWQGRPAGGMVQQPLGLAMGSLGGLGRSVMNQMVRGFVNGAANQVVQGIVGAGGDGSSTMDMEYGIEADSFGDSVEQ